MKIKNTLSKFKELLTGQRYVQTTEELFPETNWVDWLNIINEDYQRIHGTHEKIEVEMHQSMIDWDGQSNTPSVLLTLSSVHGTYQFPVTSYQLRELQSMHFLNIKDV